MADSTTIDPAFVGSPSGRRLGLALCMYFAVATLLITWAPFRFAATPQHGFSTVWSWSDLLLNVVMFLPLGFFWQSARWGGREWPWWQTLLVAATLSGLIEGGQLFLAERFSSLLDVLTNTLGAVLGAQLFRLLRPRVPAGAETSTVLALEVPLMGLVILLIPLFWVATASGSNGARMWLLLLPAGFGGAVIGAVHGSATPRPWRLAPWLIPASAAAWFLVAAIPGLSTRGALLASGTGAAMASAALFGWAASHERRARAAAGRDQRIELRMLRFVLPLFATYLTLSALWPLDAVDGVWRGGWELAPARDALSRGLLLRALEYLAAFTLVGYMSAELFGRDNRRYPEAARRVARCAALLTLLLEFARGWNTAVGASGALALLAVAAAVFGGWLYHLQRDHIRARLGRAEARLAARDSGASEAAERGADARGVAKDDVGGQETTPDGVATAA